MNSLDWFQNGALLMLMSLAVYRNGGGVNVINVVSWGLFALAVFHMVIAMGELIKGNTP